VTSMLLGKMKDASGRCFYVGLLISIRSGSHHLSDYSCRNDPDRPLFAGEGNHKQDRHRKSNKWLQREDHRKMSADLLGKG
jgi:hypothetical protein